MIKFSSYEATNTPWIGNIPTGWSLKSLKHIFTEKKSTKNSGLGCGSISFGQVIYKDDEKIPESTKESYQEVLDGEFLINPLNLNYDLKSLRIGLSRINVVVSQGYIVLNIREGFVPEYYEYLLRKFDVEHMKSLGQGVRQTISYTHLKDEKLVVPPVEEQLRISRYLDKKTRQVDSLISKTEKKIELLKEQRTSLINQCVTKGQDPNVQMKDSEVEWVADIPEHWNMYPIKRIFLEYFGGSWGEDPVEKQTENLVRVIRVTEFDMDVLTVTSDIPTIRSLNLSTDSKKLVKKNDLILEKSGGGEKTPVGRIVLVDREIKFPTINSNFTNICRPNPDIVDPKFALFSLFAGYINGRTLRNIKQTTGIQNLDLDGFMTELIPLPPLEEQREIACFLETENKVFLKKVNHLMRYIELLKEYRHSIISSTVTGKVRVTEEML